MNVHVRQKFWEAVRALSSSEKFGVRLYHARNSLSEIQEAEIPECIKREFVEIMEILGELKIRDEWFNFSLSYHGQPKIKEIPNRIFAAFVELMGGLS